MGVKALQTLGDGPTLSSPLFLLPASPLSHPLSLPLPPLIQLVGLGERCKAKLPSGSGPGRATERILVHLEVKNLAF